METISMLALEEIPHVGSKTIEKALSITPSFDPRSPSDLVEILKKANAKYGRITVPDTQTAAIGWNKAHEIWKQSQKHNIQIISRESSNYPKYLSHISDSPPLLHVLGNINALKRDCIAIIGTRKPTEYGISAARKLGAYFAQEGYVVVSGLANGIDTAAHRGALDVNGTTIAVLAHGLDTVYPAKNKELAEEICRNNGALVSEYAWGTKINQSNFIARDRIQSGLSIGVFVVETGTRGGTLHTAKYCIEQKRILIVLKHPEILAGDPAIEGNTQLIKDKIADIVFENDDELDLIKIEMKRVRDNLLMHPSKKKMNYTNSNQMTLKLSETKK